MKNFWKSKHAYVIFVSITALLLVFVISQFVYLGLFVFNRYSFGTVPTKNQLLLLKQNGQTYEHVVIFGVDDADRI